MLSGCCHNSLNTADSLRSEHCPTVEISIVEMLLQWRVETLCCSLIPPRRKPHIKLHEAKLLNLLGRGGPQVKMYHWRRTLLSGGGRDPLRCVGGLGETGAQVRPSRFSSFASLSLMSGFHLGGMREQQRVSTRHYRKTSTMHI